MSDSDFDVRVESDRLLLAVRFLADLDLAALAEAIERADVIGPLLDPTAYRDMLHRKGNMHDVARLVQLAQPLVAEFRALQESLDG